MICRGTSSLSCSRPHIEDMDNSNNCGIVLKIEGVGPEGFAYLVTGDTEIPRWDRIVELFDDALAADCWQRRITGSKNAAHAGMALAVMPEHGVDQCRR